MTKFIGNILDIFDCDKLISQTQKHSGETHRGHLPLPEDHPKYKDFILQDTMAKKAGYDTNGAMEFRHFKPGEHFDQKFVDIFSSYVKAIPSIVFVSEISPGKMAPWHYDIDLDWHNDKDKGEQVRYHLHLSKPADGHVFIVDKEVFYNIPQGNVYQWKDPSCWHAGTNCGIETKYIFSFKGYA